MPWHKHYNDGSMVIVESRFGHEKPNALLHRLRGPAVYFVNEQDEVVNNFWYYFGDVHRDDGPAINEYYSNGNPRCLEWAFMGDYHRIGGPARWEFYANGRPRMIQWRIKGRVSNKEGPTEIRFDEIGGVRASEWKIGEEYLLFDTWFETSKWVKKLTPEERIILKLLGVQYFTGQSPYE